jgi:hypothetical protein
MHMYFCVLIEVADQFIVSVQSQCMLRKEFEDNQLLWLCQICLLLLPLPPPRSMAPRARPKCQICTTVESKYSCPACLVV